MQNLIHRPVYKFLSTMDQFNKHLMLTITLPKIMHGNYMPDMSIDSRESEMKWHSI